MTMPPTYTLSIPDPQPGIPPGDRWCALSGPHAPLPAILASADEWLLIAGAIEAGKARSAGARFTPDATGGYLDALGTMSVAYLTTADLLALAADIRAKLAPPDRAGCPAPIEATAEEMGALLAIAARPRQTDPTDPDVIASAPRPTVAEQPPQAPAWTVEPVHNGLTRHTVTRGRVRLTVLSGYDDGTTHGEIAIVYGPGREDSVRKSWFGGANRTAEESLAEALDGTLSMAREIGAVATPPTLPADLTAAHAEIARLRALVVEAAASLRGEDGDPDGEAADEYVRRAHETSGQAAAALPAKDTDQPDGRWWSLAESQAYAHQNVAAGRAERLASVGAVPAAWAGRTRAGEITAISRDEAVAREAAGDGDGGCAVPLYTGACVIPADLRGLLDALVAADEAWNHSPSPLCASMDDLREMGRRYRHAIAAVAEWHRGAGGGR